VPPEYDAYVRRLRERIQTRLQYPREAVRRGLHGVVELEIRIEPDGRLGQAEVVGGVPVPLLQRAALHAVEAATPAPFPPGVAARPLTIRLPVVFELR
jgi:protein TonB